MNRTMLTRLITLRCMIRPVDSSAWQKPRPWRARKPPTPTRLPEMHRLSDIRTFGDLGASRAWLYRGGDISQAPLA